MNHELPEFQAGFRKDRGPRDQIANIRWIMEKAREFQKNIYVCFIDYAKAFDCVDHNKLDNPERDGNTRPPDLPLEKSICRSGSKVRTGHGTTDWFHLGKEYDKAVYCHSAYLTSMQSTSCKMLGWMKHKLESRLPGDWRRKWQPTPVFLPGKVHGQRSLAGCSPWGYMTVHVCMWVVGNGLVAINWLN